MKYLYPLTLPVLMVFTGNALYSQTSFSLSPSIVYAEKPKTTFVLYNFTALENLTSDTLHMRWVKTSVVAGASGHGGGDFNNWTIAVQDPNNYHTPANDLDSADFVLTPSANFTDKFLLHLHPNNTAGNLVATFKLFPIANTADSAIVKFDYTVLDVASAVEEHDAGMGLSIYPNPATEKVLLRNTAQEALEVTWIGPDGKRHETTRILSGEAIQEQVAGKVSGTWQLLVRNGMGFQASFPLIIIGR
ncbi:MAG: hypothetical protein IPN76_21560 [Saprospiraceae bacterium]|nr:hypothetical protein [Saprospiraceae bacterium]